MKVLAIVTQQITYIDPRILNEGVSHSYTANYLL